jgi:hypothetical protein
LKTADALPVNFRITVMNKEKIILVIFIMLSAFVFADLPASLNIEDNLNNDELWQFFLESPDSETKARMLIALGVKGKGDRNITEKINNYLTELNALFDSGTGVDYLLVSASITAIMELNDSSSYPVLFPVLHTGFPEVIASEARGALDEINGDLFQFLSGVIENNPPVEKFTALKAGISSKRLSVSERGRLASLALERALGFDEDDADLTAMRYAAVLELTSLRWKNANALAVMYYYRAREDFVQNISSKSRFIEAIACLGAVGNSEAAFVLGLQLGLINERTERRGGYDAEITLAIVQALGNIGSKTVFDHLLYVNRLSYPDHIKTAAREAVDRIKW